MPLGGRASGLRQGRGGGACRRRRARFLGGGTLLVRAAIPAISRSAAWCSPTAWGSTTIRVEGGRVEIGAAVTMATSSPSRSSGFLHDVAQEIGGPAVRAMATVGGNLFARAPYGDFAVALLALDAEVATEDAEKSESLASKPS